MFIFSLNGSAGWGDGSVPVLWILLGKSWGKTKIFLGPFRDHPDTISVRGVPMCTGSCRNTHILLGIPRWYISNNGFVEEKPTVLINVQ